MTSKTDYWFVKLVKQPTPVVTNLQSSVFSCITWIILYTISYEGN